MPSVIPAHAAAAAVWVVGVVVLLTPVIAFGNTLPPRVVLIGVYCVPAIIPAVAGAYVLTLLERTRPGSSFRALVFAAITSILTTLIITGTFWAIDIEAPGGLQGIAWLGLLSVSVLAVNLLLAILLTLVVERLAH